MKILLQYRTAAIAGLTTQFFFGFVRIAVYQAFYENGTAPLGADASGGAPMKLAHVITYTWLGQALLAMLPMSANPDPEVRDLMRTGAVAYEFARPLDIYTLWFARAVAARLAPTLLRAGPLALVATLFFGMETPPSLAAFAAWLAATAGALLLISAFSVLITTTLLWTVSGDGIARLAPSLVILCSGLIIPLPLFPAWAQPILNFLPFRGMADAPFRLYMGDLHANAVGGILMQQCVWMLISSLPAAPCSHAAHVSSLCRADDVSGAVPGLGVERQVQNRPNFVYTASESALQALVLRRVWHVEKSASGRCTALRDKIL